METVQVLCATTGQADFSLTEAMNIQTDVIFANQNGQNRTEEAFFDTYRAVMLSTSTRGVGINRNLALMYADGDICLLADDDIRYEDGYETILQTAFAEHPAADVLLFNLYESEGYVIPSLHRIRWYNFMRYATYQIAFRGHAVRDCGIRFHTAFGGGCRYQSGEDTLFLRDCLRSGLRIYALPVYIATMKHERPSTWFRGYDKAFFYDKGALFMALSKRFAWLLCLRLLLVKTNIWKESNLSFWSAYRIMLDGARDYAKTGLP